MRIPLGVNLESRDGTVAKDARTTNSIVEVKGDGDLRVRKRPGAVKVGLVKAGAGQLLYPWQGLNTVQADTLNRGTITTIVSSPTQTTLTTTAGLQYSAADTGSNAATPRLMIKNRVNAWTVNQAGTVSSVSYGTTMGLTVYNLVSLTRSGTVATGTLSTTPTFNVGDSVTIAGAVQTDYNGAKTITAVTPGSFTPAQDVPITITRSGTTATATTVSGNHGLTNGSSYAVSGANQSAYNGSFTMTVTSPTTFTYTVSVTTTGTTTWNPSDKSANITLSGGNLVATNTALGSVRGTVGKASGKWYWEVTVSTISVEATVGIGNSSATLTNNPGADVNGWGYISQGSKTTNNSASAYGAGYSSGDVIGVALDMDNGTLTFYKNNVSQGQAFSGITGTIYPMVGEHSGDVFTANFGTTAFTYAIPTGFAALASDTPVSPASGTIVVTKPSVTVNSTFTYTVANSPATPATTASSLTASTNGGTVPGIPYIDGYFCVMDVNGVINNSASDDPTSWPALNIITAQAVNGAGKALNRSQNYLIAFKEWSTEYFYDAKNATGSPFSPVDNGFTLVGCASGDSVVSVDGNLMWIAQAKERGRSVYLMTGLQMQPVSTPDIERILGADDLATVYAYGLRLNGHPLYILTLVTSNITLVYDLLSKTWGQWSSLELASGKTISSITRVGQVATVTTTTAHGLSDGGPVNIGTANQTEYNGIFPATVISSTVYTIPVEGNPATPATTSGSLTSFGYTESYFRFIKYCDFQGLNLLLHESDGYIYQLANDHGQDGNSGSVTPINQTMRTVRLDGGSTELKRLARVMVVGDRVVSDGVNNYILVRWSDDDYTTNSKYRPVDLSFDQPKVRKCGAFRRRSIELKYTGNAMPVLQALELDVER